MVSFLNNGNLKISTSLRLLSSVRLKHSEAQFIFLLPLLGKNDSAGRYIGRYIYAIMCAFIGYFIMASNDQNLESLFYLNV